MAEEGAPAAHEPDPTFVDVVTRRIGGWRTGRHVGRSHQDLPLIVTLGFATLTWLICALRQLPCQATLTDIPNPYYRLCYSDIPILYQDRSLASGVNPYGMEYPVLTNMFVDLSRRIAQLFGAPVGPDLGWPQTLESIHLFTYVTGALLFLCYLGVVACHVAMQPTRPWDAMMIAAAPVVAAAGLVNWDMLCLLCMALALLMWAKRHPTWSGVFIGLGVAAKLYPGLLLLPLLVLCLRERKYADLLKTAGGAALAWAVPNLIIHQLFPGEWAVFWTFNADRGSDLGSLWYAAGLVGLRLPDSITLPMAVLFMLGVAAIATLGFYAPRRPRVAQLLYLTVMWFLVVNKVYSPQYVLWLLPLVVLARPRWRDYLIWTLAELAYFCAIWGHLAQTLLPPGGGIDKLYVAAILVRVGAELWLGAMVVLDILRPEEDVVRADGTDDPIGGVLLDAPRPAPPPTAPAPTPAPADLSSVHEPVAGSR